MAKEDYAKWSRDELVKEIKKLKKRKKYGLVWEEKPETVAELCKEKLPVLKEIKNREIKTDETKPINILIEGDNFHALSVLNYTSRKSIDVVYIDPPYNRGTGDQFIYNDKIVDEEDMYRHSKWLSFMAKRLKLARNLLKNSGVLFVSIDDNELSQLKLLCDDIFGEKNFIATLIWHKKYGGGSDNKNIVTEHEYILCYSRKNEEVFRGLELKSDETLNYEGPDKEGRYYKTEGLLLRGPNSTKEARPNLCYPITCPDSTVIWPRDGKGTWRYSPERLQEEIKKNNIIFKKTERGWRVFYKIYLYTEEGEERGKKARTILDNRYNVGQTGEGTTVLKNILRNSLFTAPKPVTLIKHLIKLCRTNDVILDFFAGSGTTGQAVLELDDEDGGNRRFILCTDNENNICTEILYPRIEKVMNGYENINGERITGLRGNLKYFKTAFVDSEPTDINKKRLVDQSTEMLCLKEYCFDEVKSGQYFKIFKDSVMEKYLGIAYDDEGIEPLKKEIKKINRKTAVYVFSLDASAREEEFEDVIDLVDLKPIPEVILNVYRRIFK